LYSEYGLPYQLYNGKALTANVDYDGAYERFLRDQGIGSKENLIRDVKTHNNASEDFNDLM